MKSGTDLEILKLLLCPFLKNSTSPSSETSKPKCIRENSEFLTHFYRFTLHAALSHNNDSERLTEVLCTRVNSAQRHVRAVSMDKAIHVVT